MLIISFNPLKVGEFFKLESVPYQPIRFSTHSRARVILGQVPSIATCKTRTHRGESL